jgi:hypothetical protein
MLSSGRYAFAQTQPAARRLDYHEPPRSKSQYAIEKRVTTLAGESHAHFIDFHVWRAWHTPYSRHFRGRVETSDHIAGGTRADCDRADRISPNTKAVGLDGDSRSQASNGSCRYPKGVQRSFTQRRTGHGKCSSTSARPPQEALSPRNSDVDLVCGGRRWARSVRQSPMNRREDFPIPPSPPTHRLVARTCAAKGLMSR